MLTIIIILVLLNYGHELCILQCGTHGVAVGHFNGPIQYFLPLIKG